MLDCIIEAGYTRQLSSVTLSKRNGVVSTVTTYHLFLKVLCNLHQQLVFANCITEG